jgi:hypothetical protein
VQTRDQRIATLEAELARAAPLRCRDAAKEARDRVAAHGRQGTASSCGCGPCEPRAAQPKRRPSLKVSGQSSQASGLCCLTAPRPSRTSESAWSASRLTSRLSPRDVSPGGDESRGGSDADCDFRDPRCVLTALLRRPNRLARKRQLARSGKQLGRSSRRIGAWLLGSDSHRTATC